MKNKTKGAPLKAKEIYKETTFRECLLCKEIKPLHKDIFEIRTDGSFYSRCKKCNSNATSYREKIKRLQNNPEKYLECEDCGYYWNVTGNKKYCARCGAKGSQTI